MPFHQPTRISLVRHGHVHNPEDIIYGRLPGYGLSAGGRQQAQAAADVLREHAIAAFFSSPMLRARQTTRILMQYHPGAPWEVSEHITEILVSDQGRPASEVAARGWDMYSGAGPEFEQPEQIAARAHEFLAQMRRDYAGQHVVAVSHGDVIAFAVLRAMGEPVTPALKRTLDRFDVSDGYPMTGSITTLIYSGDGDDILAVDYVRPYGDELALAAPS